MPRSALNSFILAPIIVIYYEENFLNCLTKKKSSYILLLIFEGAMKNSRRAWEKFDRLKDEVCALTENCESKSLRFAFVCGANDGNGGSKRLRQDIKSFKRIKASLLKYLKEIRKLTARYE